MASFPTAAFAASCVKERARGGHDLRGWFITTCQAHGAHRDLLRVVTHTAPGDVIHGYTRAPWAALCGEVTKLRVTLPDGEVLAVDDSVMTVGRSAGLRWRKLATPAGFETAF